MIERLFNKYSFILLTLLFMHVLTVTVDGFLSFFDYILVIFILTMYKADEDNFIWLSLIFGFFSDFARDGFYGPGVVIFIIFYLIRFRTDVIMDMTKIHYKVLLYFGLSFAYCLYNLMITHYLFDNALFIAFVRTLANISLVFIFQFFFKGLSRVTQNS